MLLHLPMDYDSDVSYESPGLPLGLKFEPTDGELIEHLAENCAVGNSKPHIFIVEFITTLELEKGACYSLPENLHGNKKLLKKYVTPLHLRSQLEDDVEYAVG